MRKPFVCLMLLMMMCPLALRLLPTEARPAPGGAYLLDRALGEQPRLIRAWGRLNSLLGDSGSPQVVMGRDGYLFFRPALDSVLGQGLMTDREVAALARALKDLQLSLREQGTAFALLVAPDKGQVAGRCLPCHIRPADQAGSNARRLLARLERLGVPAPDLRALFLKEEGDTYLPRDTHWSAYGACLALREGLAALGIEGLPACSRQDFNTQIPAPGDLTPLCLPGWDDGQTDLAPNLPRSYRALRPIRSLDDLRIMTEGPAGGPRLLVARDSFGRALFPYLANLAGSLDFSRDYAGLAGRAQGADGVLVVIAQRDLPQLLSRLDPGAGPMTGPGGSWYNQDH